MKQQGLGGNNAHLWRCLEVKIKSDAVKNNIAQELGMLGPWIKANWTDQAGDGKNEHQHYRNHWAKMDGNGLGEFNSGDHYIYYCGQESHRRNGVALIVKKSLKCSTWVQSQKWQNDLGSFPRQTIEHHSNPSLCLHHWGRRNWIWSVLWRPIRPSRANTKKRCPFHHKGIGMQR